MKIFGLHIHKHSNPWNEVPPWVIELRLGQEILMSVTDDLQAAITALQQQVAATKAELERIDAKITGAAPSGTPDDVVAAATAAITGSASDLKTATDASTAAVP